jgi:biopolymer transport protein ExbD
MKIRPGSNDDVRFEMTAMMDIVFQLIAFFMIVSTFIVAEKVEVDLPVAPQAALAENQQGRLVISILADGSLWLGTQPLRLEEVNGLAAQWVREQASPRVVIRSDRTATYAVVKQVMKACRDAGLTDLIFASYQSDS